METVEEIEEATQRMHSENVLTQNLVQTLSTEGGGQEQSPQPRPDKRPMTEDQMEMEKKKKKKSSAVFMKDAIKSRRAEHQKLLEQLGEAEARRIAVEEGTLHLEG